MTQTSSRRAVLGGQPLEQRVGRRGEADLERAVGRVLAHPVEDDDAAGAADGDEARQRVDELAPVGEVARVQDVVAVEEVEHCLRMPAPRWGQVLHASIRRSVLRCKT